MISVQSQNLTNLCIQIFDIITLSLLSESAEIIQILTNLGSGDFHALAQVVGGNALYTVFQ